MSTEALVEGPSGVVAAWETDGQIYFAHVKPGTSDIADLKTAPGSAPERKHPALAVNAQGDMLLAWTEGTGWEKGGALAWQVFDKAGKATRDKGRLDGGIPVWSLPTAAATPEGDFIILH